MFYISLTDGVKDCQNLAIPSCNSAKLVGLYVACKYCSSDPQMFSIGLRSGDSGGVLHQLIPCFSKNSLCVDWCVWGRCLAVICDILGSSYG